MKFLAEINVMPLKNLLDPQGKAVKNTLNELDYKGVSLVRIGKHINIEFEAETETEAENMAEKICKEVLANQVMETFSVNISPIVSSEKSK